MRDHPRSRGVYDRDRRRSTTYFGSSPLARGLRQFARRRGHLVGIIPARAGFTAMTGQSRCGQRDHPRSRGVYLWKLKRTPKEDGSSPLARGLRNAVTASSISNRIIPARAGFTLSTSAVMRLCPDHPRSRGVYSEPRTGASGSSGSSPLARGLHVEGACGEILARIIPARAGFTSRARYWEDICAGIIPARAGFTC